MTSSRSLRREKNENKISIRYFQNLNYIIVGAVFVANIFFQLSEVSSSIFLYVGTLIMIGTLFFIDKDEYIYLSVALISVLRFSTIFNVSVINIITIVYFVKAYLLENEYKREKDKRRMPKTILTAGLFYVFYSLRNIFAFESNLRSVLLAIKITLFLVYLSDIFRCCESKKEAAERMRKILVYYVYGVAVAILASIIINPEYSLHAERMALGDRTGVNQLGISLAFCITFLSIGVTKAKSFYEWFVIIITALPLLYFCFATQSRTAIVMLIITLVSCVVFGYAQKESRLWITLMVIGVVVVLGGLIVFGEGTPIHGYIMETIDRFENPRGGDITGGRFGLWTVYIDVLKSNPWIFFFGGKLEDFTSTQAHNMFLEVFAGVGFFGTIIVIWLYTSVFVEIRKSLLKFGKPTFKFLSFLPFAAVFITGMASHSLLNTEPTVNFCIGVAMIYLYGEESENENTLADSNEPSNRFVSKRKRTQNFRRMDRRNSEKLRTLR